MGNWGSLGSNSKISLIFFKELAITHGLRVTVQELIKGLNLMRIYVVVILPVYDPDFNF